MLAVEIVNGDVFYQAEFGAAQLAEEPVSIDFVVAPELGIESGVAVPVSVKFVYRANGPIAVGEIELIRLDAAFSPPDPAAPAATTGRYKELLSAE